MERIVREEMDAIGAQEVHFPALLPKEPYEASGRWTEYGPNIFRLKDRKGADYLLGPTHEEMFTLLVKDLYSSYKDLPLSLYQIQTKYRDEARPRAGILRGREFVMKDSYSFDIDDAGLQKSYDLHRDAYIKIFNRLGLEYVIVHAMSGAMGGSASEEFLAVAENGEDTFVRLAGRLRGQRRGGPRHRSRIRCRTTTPRAAHVEDTPDTPTIATLVAVANAALPRVRSGLDRGRHAEERGAHGHRAGRHPGAAGRRRSRGPGGRPQAADRPAGAGRGRALRRRRLRCVPDAGQGLHRAARHWARTRRARSATWSTRGWSLVPGGSPARTSTASTCSTWSAAATSLPDGTIEAAEVREGDAAPDGSGPLRLARGIEMGHVFQLGRKYAEALGLKVLDANGKLVTVTMGSYGVGVSRAVAAVAENTCDDKGLCWPRELAPFDVHLVATGKDEAVLLAAHELAQDLDEAGIAVLLDDRKASPGVKFADAEILGMPTIVVVGRGLAEGQIEIRDRGTGERTDVDVAEAAGRIVAIVHGHSDLDDI